MKAYFLIFFTFFQLLGVYGVQIKEAPLDVITRDSLQGNGFISTQLVDNKLYLELRDSLLNREMLFVRHNNGYSHEYKHVIWSKHNDHILLEEKRVESSSGIIIPLKNNSENDKNILALFPIIKDKSNLKTYLVDITDLLITDNLAWGPGLNEKVVSSLSYITNVKSLENEVIIQTRQVVVQNQAKVTVTITYSFFFLPDPMKPRRFDYRMGFFSEDITSGINYVTNSPVANISRWRLEKKFKNMKISVPIKPITFTLSSEIPKKWRPYVKAGIMEWLPAFEAAGFKNAIMVAENNKAHTNAEMNSVNRSMVRWGNLRNVRGFEDNVGSNVSSIIDLRSGEILKSDILIGSTLQHLSDDYFIRCGPIDSRALQYPFPDDLMGELIQYLVAHEAGHAFGLMDANYGEYTYPLNKIRDENWLKKMGHTPSIMTYARHNYVVQPEDSIPPSLLIQKVGPTDLYNIRWAYTPFYNDTAENERDALEAIVREQDSIPWYRYNKTRFEVIGPGSTNEVVENDSPIESTGLGLKNIKRVLELLPEVSKYEKDNALLERLYEKTLSLWYYEMKHVMSLIGGYSIHYKSGNQLGNMYTPIPVSVQKDALDFLVANAFSPPEWLVNPLFISKIKYSTYPDKLMEYQKILLLELIGQRRMKRLKNMERIKGYEGISKEILSELQSGLFADLNRDVIIIDSRKQEIQRIYIDHLILGISQKGGQLNAIGNVMYSNYSKSIFMNNLMSIKHQIIDILNKDIDQAVYGHLKTLAYQLDEFK